MTKTATFPIRVNARKTSSADLVRAFASREIVRAPLFVPRSQMYYWTPDWQEGEAEALADLEAGRFRTFASGSEAAAWLLADEE